MKKILSLKNIVISLAVLVLLWQVLFMISDYSEALFPSPKMAFDAFLEMVEDGTLLEKCVPFRYRLFKLGDHRGGTGTDTRKAPEGI